jgi:hypothetical protein
MVVKADEEFLWDELGNNLPLLILLPPDLHYSPAVAPLIPVAWDRQKTPSTCSTATAKSRPSPTATSSPAANPSSTPRSASSSPGKLARFEPTREQKLLLADFWFDQGFYRRASAAYSAIQDEAPKAPTSTPSSAKATSSSAKAATRKAIPVFRAALALDPDNPKILNNLAYAMLQAAANCCRPPPRLQGRPARSRKPPRPRNPRQHQPAPRRFHRRRQIPRTGLGPRPQAHPRNPDRHHGPARPRLDRRRPPRPRLAGRRLPPPRLSRIPLPQGHPRLFPALRDAPSPPPPKKKKFASGVDFPNPSRIVTSQIGDFEFPERSFEYNFNNLLLTTQQADGNRESPHTPRLHSSVPGYPPPIMPGTDLFYPPHPPSPRPISIRFSRSSFSSPAPFGKRSTLPHPAPLRQTPHLPLPFPSPPARLSLLLGVAPAR